MTTDPVRVSGLLQRSALRHPDRIAVEDLSGVTRLTYRELWDRAERGAAALERRGLDPGDRLLLVAPAGPDWIGAFLAAAQADLAVVPVPAATPPRLARLAALFTGARAWIGPRDAGPLAGALAGLERVTPGELFDPAHEPRPARPVRPGATAVCLFTSGSSDRPRAVALSHESLRANLRALQAVRSAEADETLLSVLPPSHAYELVSGQLAPLSTGARIVYAPMPLPNRLVDALGTHAVTRALLVPALFESMARDVLQGLAADGVVPRSCTAATPAHLGDAAQNLDSAARARIRAAVRARIGPAFATVTVGGAAIDPAWGGVLACAGIVLDVGYGLTEAGPVVAIGRAGSCPPGSVGRPLPGVAVRIGDGGEVLVRTDALMQAYVGDPTVTREACEGGWLRTGDRGHLDDEGHLFITGRLKDAMVTSAGETIYPDEVEPYYASPMFAELAVVPGPGPDGNDRAILVVVPADPACGEATVARTVAALRARAPARLRIADVVRRTEPLPRTAVGKVRRRALADELRSREVLS